MYFDGLWARNRQGFPPGGHHYVHYLVHRPVAARVRRAEASRYRIPCWARPRKKPTATRPHPANNGSLLRRYFGLSCSCFHPKAAANMPTPHKSGAHAVNAKAKSRNAQATYPHGVLVGEVLAKTEPSPRCLTLGTGPGGITYSRGAIGPRRCSQIGSGNSPGRVT